MNILFVCTGNTCRSPMAEAILKNKQIHSIEVKSAGIFASYGSDASQNTIKVLEENNINHDHSSRMISEADIRWADYIFTMTAGHKAVLMENFPFAADKTFTLKEFVYDIKNGDVMDPFGGSLETYKQTYNELNDLIDRLLTKLGEFH